MHKIRKRGIEKKKVNGSLGDWGGEYMVGSTNAHNCWGHTNRTCEDDIKDTKGHSSKPLKDLNMLQDREEATLFLSFSTLVDDNFALMGFIEP